MVDARLNEPYPGEPPELSQEAQKALARVYTRLLKLADKREARLAAEAETERLSEADTTPAVVPIDTERTPARALDTIRSLLESTTSDSPRFPPTLIYNEGWLLRLILDWFSKNRFHDHPLRFEKGARWYSEALLPSAFLARRRGDSLAETWTHADGVIGHFEIGSSAKGDLTLLANAAQFVVTEAKLFSGLSGGVRNAPYFDQAGRNVACMAEVLRRAARRPADTMQLGFYVLAPDSQIQSGVFGESLEKRSILERVQRRVQAYNGARDDWYLNWFRPTWDRIDVASVSWEAIIAAIEDIDAPSATSIQLFYEQCLMFNRGA